jgi:hypothetical protein
MPKMVCGYLRTPSISPRLKRLLPNVPARKQILSVNLEGMPYRYAACDIVANCLKSDIEPEFSKFHLIFTKEHKVVVRELMLNMAMHGQGGEFVINQIVMQGSGAFDRNIVEVAALDNGAGISEDMNVLLASSREAQNELNDHLLSDSPYNPVFQTNLGTAIIFRFSDQLEVETCGARWVKMPDDKFQKLRGRITEGSYFRLLFNL